MTPNLKKKNKEIREKLGRSDVTRREKQKLAVFVFVRVPRSSTEKSGKGKKKERKDNFITFYSSKRLKIKVTKDNRKHEAVK